MFGINISFITVVSLWLLQAGNSSQTHFPFRFLEADEAAAAVAEP